MTGLGIINLILIISIIVIIYHAAKPKDFATTTLSDFYEFEHRSVALAIFLSIITCGIYYIYWFVRIIRQVKEFHGDYTSCAGEYA